MPQTCRSMSLRHKSGVRDMFSLPSVQLGLLIVCQEAKHPLPEVIPPNSNFDLMQRICYNCLKRRYVGVEHRDECILCHELTRENLITESVRETHIDVTNRLGAKYRRDIGSSGFFTSILKQQQSVINGPGRPSLFQVVDFVTRDKAHWTLKLCLWSKKTKHSTSVRK